MSRNKTAVAETGGEENVSICSELTTISAFERKLSIASLPTREIRSSSFIQATHLGDSGASPWGDWPADSRYFDPLLMDATSIVDLLKEDTIYASDAASSWHPEYLHITDNILQDRKRQAHGDLEGGMFDPIVLRADCVLVHVRQMRHFTKCDSASVMSVDAPMWLTMLDKFEVLPAFVELLHDNNGSSFTHTSFGPTDAKQGSSQSRLIRRAPEAFHIAYKLGSAMDEEFALYGRYSFTTGRTFVLVLGTEDAADQSKAIALLRGDPHASMFHVVFAFLSTALAAFEKKRWQLDYDTQDFEAETGFTKFKQLGTVTAQKLEQFEWNRKNIVTACDARFMMWAASQTASLFRNLRQDIETYQATCKSHRQAQLDQSRKKNLQERCLFKARLAQSQRDQARHLQGRLNSQLDVVRTLRAQRDTDLNNEIAKAVKHDSELMRRITIITMVFLPATFVATFFSMVFFQAGNKPAVHSIDQVWWYPVITIILTGVVFASCFDDLRKPIQLARSRFCVAARGWLASKGTELANLC